MNHDIFDFFVDFDNPDQSINQADNEQAEVNYNDVDGFTDDWECTDIDADDPVEPVEQPDTPVETADNTVRATVDTDLAPEDIDTVIVDLGTNDAGENVEVVIAIDTPAQPVADDAPVSEPDASIVTEGVMGDFKKRIAKLAKQKHVTVSPRSMDKMAEWAIELFGKDAFTNKTKKITDDQLAKLFEPQVSESLTESTADIKALAKKVAADTVNKLEQEHTDELTEDNKVKVDIAERHSLLRRFVQEALEELVTVGVLDLIGKNFLEPKKLLMTECAVVLADTIYNIARDIIVYHKITKTAKKAVKAALKDDDELAIKLFKKLATLSEKYAKDVRVFVDDAELDIEETISESLTEAAPPEIKIPSYTKEEALAEFKKALKNNRFDVEAFHDAFDDEIAAEDLQKLFRSDGKLASRSSYGVLKNLPQTTLVKAIKKLWVTQFADRRSFAYGDPIYFTDTRAERAKQAAYEQEAARITDKFRIYLANYKAFLEAHPELTIEKYKYAVKWYKYNTDAVAFMIVKTRLSDFITDGRYNGYIDSAMKRIATNEFGYKIEDLYLPNTGVAEITLDYLASFDFNAVGKLIAISSSYRKDNSLGRIGSPTWYVNNFTIYYDPTQPKDLLANIGVKFYAETQTGYFGSYTKPLDPPADLQALGLTAGETKHEESDSGD